MAIDGDDIWTEALEEAYAAAPASAIVLSTIELRHDTFTDQDGNLIAIRMLRDPGNLLEAKDDSPDIRGLYLTIEDSASFQPGESVIFQSVMFNFTLPEQSDSQISGMQFELDNVTKLVSGYLDKAVKTRSAMVMVYREYLADDVTIPQMVINNLSVKTVTSTIFKVTANADFLDFINKKFPNKEYKPDDYPGLVNS